MIVLNQWIKFLEMETNCILYPILGDKAIFLLYPFPVVTKNDGILFTNCGYLNAASYTRPYSCNNTKRHKYYSTHYTHDGRMLSIVRILKFIATPARASPSVD